MYSYGTIALTILLLELTRRILLSLKSAYFGPLSKIPGPFLFKFTHLPWMYLNVKGTMMYPVPAWFRKYGHVIRISPSEVLVGSKDGIQKILVEEDLIKAPVYDLASPEGKITSLISERDKGLYKKKRRHLSPGFAIAYLNGLEGLMQDCMVELVETLNNKCKEAGGETVIDIQHVLSNLTSDVMSATSFGGSTHLVATDDTKYHAMFTTRLLRSVLDANFPWLKHIPFVPPQQIEEMNDMIDDIVAKRRAENAKGEMKRDLLQIFLETRDEDPEGFTVKHLREEMVLFMIAGSDTTSLTATFTLLLLVNNPDKLKKLEEEIHASFSLEQSGITFSVTQELPYLNAVIKESMRVLPIVAASLSRYTTQTTIIDGYEIPPDTVVGAYLSGAMKDPQIWPDAEDYIPERWLGKYKGVEPDRKAYFPFSAGTRNCPGQQFALKELRLIIANLVRKYELTLVPGQSHEFRIRTVPVFVQGFYKVGIKPKTA